MDRETKSGRPLFSRAGVYLAGAIVVCSIYANLAFAVKNPATYRFFPPFKRYHNLVVLNRQLGAEYFNIANSLRQGKGFANPFGQPTGPTAWMPPILTLIEAGLLWLCSGNRDAVMAVVIVLQVQVLIGTGLLVLALVRQTARRIAPLAAAVVFLIALLVDFRQCFQATHDCWLVMLAVDLLVVGLCWRQPMASHGRAACWGVFGGLCALINPIVGFAWAMMSLLVGKRQRFRLGIAVLAAGLVLLPWTVRNYLVFGRMIPVKSNAAYELYQSQCLQGDGLIQRSTFLQHPYGIVTNEGQEYRTLGEIAFLDRKREQFWRAVRADPLDFLDRAANRLVGATLWYVPFDPADEANWPLFLRTYRLIYPLPFLGLLILLGTSFWQRLHWAQWAVVGVYLLYLLPYVSVSYYDRYAIPLIGVKVLLVIWGADRLRAALPARIRTEKAKQPVGSPRKASKSVVLAR